jgi:NADH dehydrogenase
MRADEQKHVLILGGGFGGLYTALHLEKALKNEPRLSVTLVNRENFFLFTPMLHEVAAGDLDLANIVNPIRKLLKRVNFIEGAVESLDLAARKVVLTHGFDGHAHEHSYDYLVLGLGSTTSFYNLPGVEQNSITMKSLDDAVQLRNRLIAFMEEADSECSAERRPLLTFVVAGGGFAGVETIASINSFVRESLRFYPNLREDDVRFLLVHPGKVILPELDAKLGSFAEREMRKRGVEIRGGVTVVSADEGSVTLSDGETIRARTLLWTAGTMPSPLLKALPCHKERGRITVDDSLAVPGEPCVWALGDCALVPDPTTGGFHPPTAQHALRQGKTVAHNILAELRGTAKKPFRFKTLGQLATVGRRAGVASIFGFCVSGLPAWFLWRTIYWMKLPRFEKKLRVAFDWTLDLLFTKDLVQYVSYRPAMASKRIEEKPLMMVVGR